MTHPPTISCPTCGGAVPIGVPRGSTIESVTAGGAETDGPGDPYKTRSVTCPEGHLLSFRFVPGNTADGGA